MSFIILSYSATRTPQQQQTFSTRGWSTCRRSNWGRQGGGSTTPTAAETIGAWPEWTNSPPNTKFLGPVGPMLGPGPFAVCGRPQKNRFLEKNNIPYVLKYIVLVILVTFCGTLQIWHPQHKWLLLQESPRNSVLGAGLKVQMPWIPIRFPKSFLEIENLGQNVIVHLCTLDYLKLL